MSKKRHQREPNKADDDSTDSEDKNQNSECDHIHKSIDLNKVKKSIVKTDFLSECPECIKNPTLEPPEIEMEFDESLWLCLKCGNQACGRGKNRHALVHNETPHSDSHALCVNTTDWQIWCYNCDNEVNISCRKKLLEAIEYLQKQMNTSSQNKAKNRPGNEDKVKDAILSALSSSLSNTGALPKKTIASINAGMFRARGLTNLGNTCFFNSVMQCLGHTPYLAQLLDETAESQHFKIPGGILKIKDKEDITLPPLEGETEPWRPLMQALAETLHELQSGRPEIHNPRNLLLKFTSKMPQFGGGDQHDSHELLRHLLEAVHEEDKKRFKVIILQKLGLNTKTDPNTVNEEKKQITKFYGQQVSEMLLTTEQVFRGVLVSTLQCQTCEHLSHREEKFLDLSLPISEKQIAPVLRRKADDNADDQNKPSKHQLKKEKKAEWKKNKKLKYNKPTANNLIITDNTEMDVSMENNNKSDGSDENEESDADIEDNVDNNVLPFIGGGGGPTMKSSESGYNSDKIENNSSPDSNNFNININSNRSDTTIDDSGIPSPSIINNCIIPSSMISPNNSPASSEANIDMESPVLEGKWYGSNLDDEFGDGNSGFTRPMSRLAFVGKDSKNVDLKDDLEKLSLMNDGDSTKINRDYLSEEGACAMEISNDVMDETEDDFNDDTNNSYEIGTLAPRYQCEENECSVESCLNQFTECELLMGSNKVGCDLCTKRSGNKKTVYTDASKQLLIYNPPPVLILHLKRFQVYRFRSAKVSKFVKFSTLLDLGPFCSKRSQNLAKIPPGQTKILYSLYGVVEHSGGMHGGHYIAYVKVRAPLTENSERWQFLPKNQQEIIKNLELKNNNSQADQIKTNTTAKKDVPEAPFGKWYYISDTYVTDADEAKVLGAQAYLLFYERLF